MMKTKVLVNGRGRNQGFRSAAAADGGNQGSEIGGRATPLITNASNQRPRPTAAAGGDEGHEMGGTNRFNQRRRPAAAASGGSQGSSEMGGRATPVTANTSNQRQRPAPRPAPRKEEDTQDQKDSAQPVRQKASNVGKDGPNVRRRRGTDEVERIVTPTTDNLHHPAAPSRRLSEVGPPVRTRIRKNSGNPNPDPNAGQPKVNAPGIQRSKGTTSGILKNDTTTTGIRRSGDATTGIGNNGASTTAARIRNQNALRSNGATTAVAGTHINSAIRKNGATTTTGTPKNNTLLSNGGIATAGTSSDGGNTGVCNGDAMRKDGATKGIRNNGAIRHGGSTTAMRSNSAASKGELGVMTARSPVNRFKSEETSRNNHVAKKADMGRDARQLVPKKAPLKKKRPQPGVNTVSASTDASIPRSHHIDSDKGTQLEATRVGDNNNLGDGGTIPAPSSDMAAMLLAAVNKRHSRLLMKSESNRANNVETKDDGGPDLATANTDKATDVSYGVVNTNRSTDQRTQTSIPHANSQTDRSKGYSSEGGTGSTEARSSSLPQGGMSSMIAAAAQRRQSRLDQGGEKKITHVEKKEDDGLSMAAMIAKRANARNKRIEDGGDLQMTELREIPEEHKVVYVDIALEAARVGTLTRLHEHTVEAVATKKEEKVWAGPSGLRTDHLRSTMYIAINEAAAMGKMKGPKPLEVTSFVQHTPKVEKEPEDIDKMKDEHGRRVVRQLYLIDRQIAEQRKSKVEDWSAEKAQDMVRYKNWEDVQLPSETTFRWRKQPTQKSQKDLMEAISNGVAERAWERNYRLS